MAGQRYLLRGIINEFWKEHRELSVSSCPEAMGVNLTETMRGIGIELEWPPRQIARQIVVAGTRKES